MPKIQKTSQLLELHNTANFLAKNPIQGANCELYS